MSLKLYNTLSRNIQQFEPLNEGRVGMYVCGPTVYGHAHLGHAKSYVSFDVLARYLRYIGYAVTYVQNITDVGHLTDDADEGEDKLINQAKKEFKHPMAVAEAYTASYFEDMDAMGCVRPDISPRATGHIPEQIELVRKLMEKGYAYQAGGSVYFDVSRFDRYGKLSGRNVEDMQAGARVDVSKDKKHPADFALWKKAEANHIMQWNSPWGMGYPGWHLECSAMSMKYLGKTIDIHGGGIENQFPHHECEIAQSEAANGVQFVRFWVHHNMVTVNGQKMGKSLNNFITLKQLFKEGHELLSRKYDPLAVRQLILQSHYRSPIDFSDDAIAAAQSGYDRISQAVVAIRKNIAGAADGDADEGIVTELNGLKDKFEQAMNDDLNTAVALSIVFELVKLSGRVLGKDGNSAGTLRAIDDMFSRLGGDVLGIVKDEYVQAAGGGAGGEDELPGQLVGILIEQRKEARARKDFAAGDAIRDRLAELGVVLEDKPGGATTWRRK